MTKGIKVKRDNSLIFSQREMLRELEKKAGRDALELVLGRRIALLAPRTAKSLVDAMPELSISEMTTIRDLLFDSEPKNLNLALMALAVKKGEVEGTTSSED